MHLTTSFDGDFFGISTNAIYEVVIRAKYENDRAFVSQIRRLCAGNSIAKLLLVSPGLSFVLWAKWTWYMGIEIDSVITVYAHRIYNKYIVCFMFMTEILNFLVDFLSFDATKYFMPKFLLFSTWQKLNMCFYIYIYI